MADTSHIILLRPLFHKVVVGVDASGRWYMDDEPISGEGHLSLLPLLEPGYGGDYYTAAGMLVSRLSEVGLPSALADTFPFDAPVRLGLLGGGRWGELACEWLRFIPIDDRCPHTLVSSDQQTTVPRPSWG